MDPADLIHHAQQLVSARRGAPRQAELRRAISAAYYALFHCILRATADELIGSNAAARRSAAYALVYRGFEHSHMKMTCIELSKPQLPQRFATALGIAQLPQMYRATAGVFVSLQELRHIADYAPVYRFYKSDAQTAITQAMFGIANITAGTGNVRRAFLVSMLLKSR